MKLSTIFAIAAVSDARKKPKTAASEAKKLKRNIQFVWDEWYGFCNEKELTGRYERFNALVDLSLARVAVCGSDPNATSRKRRSEEEEDDEPQTHEERGAEFFATFEENSETDGEGTLMRVSKTDRLKAVKQLGNVLKRYAQTYLYTCEKGLKPNRVEKRAKKLSRNMSAMGCATRNLE